MRQIITLLILVFVFFGCVQKQTVPLKLPQTKEKVNEIGTLVMAIAGAYNAAISNGFQIGSGLILRATDDFYKIAKDLEKIKVTTA